MNPFKSILSSIDTALWLGDPMFWQCLGSVYYLKMKGKTRQEIEEMKSQGEPYLRLALSALGIPEWQITVFVEINSVRFAACLKVAFAESPSGNCGVLVLFRDSWYKGQYQVFDLGEHRASAGQLNEIGNDQASSALLASGFHANLCAHEPENANGMNVCHVLSDPCHPDFESFRFNDQCSYVHVYQPGT